MRHFLTLNLKKTYAQQWLAIVKWQLLTVGSETSITQRRGGFYKLKEFLRLDCHVCDSEATIKKLSSFGIVLNFKEGVLVFPISGGRMQKKRIALSLD